MRPGVSSFSLSLSGDVDMAGFSALTKLVSITMLAPLTYDQIGHIVAVMQRKITTSDILHRWPTRRAVHEDALAADPSLEMVAVHRWFQRGSLPPKFDAALLAGAFRRGIGLHAQEFANARAGNIGDHPPANGAPTPHAQAASREKRRAG